MWVESRQRHACGKKHSAQTHCMKRTKNRGFVIPRKQRVVWKSYFFSDPEKRQKCTKYTKCTYVRRWSFDRKFCSFYLLLNKRLNVNILLLKVCWASSSMILLFAKRMYEVSSCMRLQFPLHEVHFVYVSHNSIKPRETRAGSETKILLGKKYGYWDYVLHRTKLLRTCCEAKTRT